MNGKPTNRKKKDNTIPTMDGLTLTMQNAALDYAKQIYPFLMRLSYAYMAELIEIFVRGGMPEDRAKEQAAAIAVKAVARFTESQKRGINGQSTAG